MLLFFIQGIFASLKIRLNSASVEVEAEAEAELGNKECIDLQ